MWSAITAPSSSRAKCPVSRRCSSSRVRSRRYPRAHLRRKDVVVLAPHHERRGLVRPEVGLPRGVEREIGPVVVEQSQLDLLVARAVQQELVRDPEAGADHLDVTNAMGVLPLGGLEDERLRRAAVFRASAEAGAAPSPLLWPPLGGPRKPACRRYAVGQRRRLSCPTRRSSWNTKPVIGTHSRRNDLSRAGAVARSASRATSGQRMWGESRRSHMTDPCTSTST